MQHAVISVIGRDRPGIVNDLTQLILSMQLNVEDSRMTVLGGEFAVLLLVTGTSDALSDLEAQLGVFSSELDLSYVYRATSPRETSVQWLPYSVRVMAMDHPGIVHKVAGFFSARNINIENLSTETQHAAHTGTPIFNVDMRIQVPLELKGAVLRENFLEFCSEQDLDGTLEPGG